MTNTKNRRLPFLLAILASVTILAMFTGCAGVKARDHVLMPIAAQVYGNVRADIDRGIADAVEDGDLTATEAATVTGMADSLGSILDSGDRSQLSTVSWTLLEPYAIRGVQDRIDDAEVSEGVATVMLQRIVNFRDVLAELGQRVSFTPAGSVPQRIDGVLVGFRPVVDLDWTPLTPHNTPRAALGLPLLTEEPSYFIKGRR